MRRVTVSLSLALVVLLSLIATSGGDEWHATSARGGRAARHIVTPRGPEQLPSWKPRGRVVAVVTASGVGLLLVYSLLMDREKGSAVQNCPLFAPFSVAWSVPTIWERPMTDRIPDRMQQDIDRIVLSVPEAAERLRVTRSACLRRTLAGETGRSWRVFLPSSESASS